MQVGDTAVLRVVGRYQFQNISNTFHYDLTDLSPDDPDALQNLTEFWSTDIAPDWLLRHSVDYSLIGIKAFVGQGTSARPGYKAVGTAGDVVGDPQESYVCRVLTRYTDSSNPRKRGRINLSGGVETMFDDTDGSVTTTEVTALATLTALLDEPIVGGGAVWTPVILNPIDNQVEQITKTVARITPSLIRSRRVRQFSIG
jgi:hypothetical protein